MTFVIDTGPAPRVTLPARYADLSPAQRRAAREQYAREQGGLCRHCKAPLSGPPDARAARLRIKRSLFPTSFFQHPVHLHHSHETGLTIGAVHNHCNAVLWQYHGE